jgi:outer membrane protein insertion porin family
MLVLAGVVPSRPVHAQETPAIAPDPPTVQEVQFEGREWIPIESLLDASGIETGETWTDDVAVDAFDGLLRMPFVAEVSPPRVEPANDGRVRIVFRIRERAAIGKVEIVGNSSILTDTIRAAIRSKEGRPLVAADINADVELIQRICQDDGFLFAIVEAQTAVVGPGRATLTFQVNEGDRIGISDIAITGNHSISDSEIRLATGLRARRLFGVLDRGDFRPHEIDDVCFKIRELYRSQGFLDVRVDLDDVSIGTGLKHVTISLRVDEGSCYLLRGIAIEGNRIFGDDLLLPEIDLDVGGEISTDALRKASRRLVDIYQNRSDRVPTISTRLRYDDDGQGVTAVFNVDEHEHLFVGDIEVVGNWRTRTRVVLSRSALVPGDPLTLFALEDTESAIRRAGFFDSVRVETHTTERPDVRDVVITVEEAEKVGRWDVGGGAGSGQGGVGYAKIEHTNFDLFRLPDDWSDWAGAFTGGGQRLALEIIPGSIESEFRATFLEPYFFATSRSLAVEGAGFIFDRGPYDESRIIGNIEMRQILGLDDHLSAAAALWIEEVSIDDLDNDAPPVAIRDRGHTFLSYPRLSIRYADLENNAYSGPSGVLAEIRGDIGEGWTGSQADFARVKLSADWFQTFLDRDPDLRHTLHVSVESGWADGLHGDRLPFYQGFFRGGPKSFRGFEYREVGPHQANEPIGGGAMVYGTVEYSVPLFLREVRAVALFDWGLVEEDFGDVSTGRVRTSGGGGFQLRVPMFEQIIPVNIYFVKALSSQTGDDEQIFSFTFGYGL